MIAELKPKLELKLESKLNWGQDFRVRIIIKVGAGVGVEIEGGD